MAKEKKTPGSPAALTEASEHPRPFSHCSAALSGEKKALKERVSPIALQPKCLKIALAAVLFVAASTAMLTLGSSFGKAPSLPDSGDISAVTIKKFNDGTDNDSVQITNASEIEQLLMALADAHKTNQSSVNDAPLQTDYFQVDISTSPLRRFYLYFDGNRYYAEEPYTGIYRSSDKTYALFEKLYTAAETDIPRIPGEEESAVYGVARMQEGILVSEVAEIGDELPEAIIMNALIKSAAFPGKTLSSYEAYYRIRQTFPESGETHDYFAYRLSNGRAVLQTGIDGMYSMLSEELYQELEAFGRN